jgi:hypothetical protein
MRETNAFHFLFLKKAFTLAHSQALRTKKEKPGSCARSVLLAGAPAASAEETALVPAAGRAQSSISTSYSYYIILRLE